MDSESKEFKGHFLPKGIKKKVTPLTIPSEMRIDLVPVNLFTIFFHCVFHGQNLIIHESIPSLSNFS
jgi:hypothetical protein